MRKIAVLLSCILLITLLVPLQGFAEGDKGLEDAIKAVKTKITVPDQFTGFNYSIHMEGKKKVWDLNWQSADEEGLGGSMGVSVDETGFIRSYRYYKPSFGEQRKLPKFSRQEVLGKAEEFIKQLVPDIYPQLQLMDDSQGNLMYTAYVFNFTRVVNGLPFYNNNVTVEVNRETGEIQSYQCNWDGDLVFPPVDKAISPEQAQKMYTDNIGLKLVYNYAMVDENIKIFPVYVPKYNANFCIDAFTGERLEITSSYPGIYYNTGAMDQSAMATKAAGKESIVITPEEQKAIEKVSKLITQEEAEKIARDFKTLGLTDDFKVSYLNLNRDWPQKEDYVWYINFTKAAQKETGVQNASVNVTLDAMTGEIKRFYTYGGSAQTGEPKYNEAASRTAAESFLKTFKVEKYLTTEVDDTMDNIYMREMGKIPQTQYTFRYVRKVNGVPFSGNYLSVTYDAVEGKVIGFEMNWFDISFPSLEKAVPAATAYEKLFSDVGLVLQYKTKYTNEDASAKILPQGSPDLKAEVRLVYAPEQRKPLNFDAYTGNLLNYDGEPYKEIKPAVYTDIAGHFAEKQIAVLAENGISLAGDAFKPDEAVTQKDFLTLLSKTLYNYGPIYPLADSDKETEQLYRNLIREGVVKEGEKSPQSPVSREEGVKFIIRALKYDKVADLQGIFKIDFKDLDSISAQLTGYVAIAQGLGIVNGSDGFFKPKDQLTRAETAVMIYNYLQR